MHGGRELAVPEVLLMKLVEVGTQLCCHMEPDGRGRGLERVLHCDRSKYPAELPFSTLLHEFSIDQIGGKLGGRGVD